jgi:hypothetical protein
MRRRVVLGIALAATVGLATLVAPPAAAPASAAVSITDTVTSLTNQQRARYGAKALVSTAVLNATAQAWAQQLANSCTFVHSTAAYRTARTSAQGWAATGENIAAGQPTASAVVTAWMGSAGHKANIIDKRYTGIGVGYATSPRCYRTYWVQVFGIPKPPQTAHPVRLTGSSSVGSTLTASTSGWPRLTQMVFQWYRNGVAIPGTLKSAYDVPISTYKLTAADAGAKISFRLTTYRWGYFPIAQSPPAAVTAAPAN